MKHLFKITLLSIALILCFVNTSFGAITFTYDESDNKVVVTEGTEGTPADFDDFVTADRAGTAELTPEDAPVACTTNITLTYQIRPVEDLALQITFTLASTSAGAGDTLDITGTDWRGAAQNESIDVSGGDGAYTGAKYWRTITDIDCTGWADGTLKVTQPQWGVIWDYGGGQYRVDAHLHIGNGSTTTWFQSSRDMVYFAEHMEPETKGAATLTLGSLVDGEVETGAYWSVDGDTWTHMCWGGTLNIYGSTIYIRTAGMYLSIRTGTCNIKRSIFDMEGRFYLRDTMTTINVDNLYISQGDYVIFQMSPTTLTNFAMNNLVNYFTNENESIVTTGMNITNFPAGGVRPGAGLTISDIDPIWAVDMDKIRVADSDPRTYKEIYTCNITVADKDGTLLDDVIVDCEDQNTDAVWTAGTVLTGATNTGKIDEQQIEYRRKEYSATVTTYSPHKFTLSKAGYETLTLDNITVDGPIDWHLEMQAIKMPRAPIYGDLKPDDYYYAKAVNE